ncbi:hypothetical protein MBRA_02600 [Methylobacterium brachiatum]|nr:hypothetical protein MBRA_02600 [Methylobacterium brachiatum]
MSRPLSPVRKKLIEVSIPLEAINAASKKQKAPKGYPTALHKYWAQRPIAACRAILFAQLVDDPSSWPERFKTEADQEKERRRLHELVTRMVPWDASNDATIMGEVRWEIARSVAWSRGEEPPSPNDGEEVVKYLHEHAPAVYDPFSGSGSIALEAQRLGLRTFCSDLNPLAVLLSKALVDIPARFHGKLPLNASKTGERRFATVPQRGAGGLAQDIRFYGAQIEKMTWEKVGHLFPKEKSKQGNDVKVVAWLWTRTIRSPDPSARSAHVPLASNWLLSTKSGRKAWVQPIEDPQAQDGVRFEVRTGHLTKDEEARLKGGTKAGRGSHFTCLRSGVPITPDYVREEAKAGRLGSRLLAIVIEVGRSREFISPSVEHERLAKSIQGPDLPELRIDMPINPRWFSPPGYGLTTYRDLYTERQLLALGELSGQISVIREMVYKDALVAGFEDDGLRLSDGGHGADAYADAVATYLGFCVDRAADYGSTLATWLTDDNAVRGTFGRQALPMTWDFCEANFFGSSSAALSTVVGVIADVVERLNSPHPATVFQADAAKNNFPVRGCAINTDPPYYDNIGYADLSEYFYVWARRSLSSVWPEIFRRVSPSRSGELVATPYRHGGKEAAERFFMEGMAQALVALRNAASPNVPMAIYYAFKQSEKTDEGASSAGWASFLQAVVDAGMIIDGTWPLRTESAGRLVGNKANALASSIVLVCRPRPETAGTITRAEFLRELRRDLPYAMKEIIAARVGPVDFEQAVIGPGMGVFSRHLRILEEDDEPMTVKTALALINRVRLEIDADPGNFDAETQVALAWFSAHGYAEMPSGEAILLANAKGVVLQALFSSGVFRDGHGKARLVKREELPAGWSPTTDRHATIWECVQHAARALEQGGSTAAAALIRAMDRRAEDALSLAYRLYDIANAKGEAMEARVYAELAAEWPELEALAASLPEDADSGKPAPAQASLFG